MFSVSGRELCAGLLTQCHMLYENDNQFRLGLAGYWGVVCMAS